MQRKVAPSEEWMLVGMGRFELPASPTRKERSTKLSHIPTEANRILNLDSMNRGPVRQACEVLASTLEQRSQTVESSSPPA